MERKSAEAKMRQGQFYMGTGGSDGERERRYKPGRRSKSRDSQYSEASHNRHKIDPALTLRNPHRTKSHQKQYTEPDFPKEPPLKTESSKPELSLKKIIPLSSHKKSKDVQKGEEVPRKISPRSHFENDFVPGDSEVVAKSSTRFSFENDFETSEADSPIVKKPIKNTRGGTKNGRSFDADFSRKQNFREVKSPCFQTNQKSLFEDDFSPSERLDDDTGISSIKEESVNEEEDVFTSTQYENNGRRKMLSKRFSNNLRGDLKKSDSVNIFARENDPFDDEFFSCQDSCEVRGVLSKISPRNSELKWTEEFEDFDIREGK